MNTRFAFRFFFNLYTASAILILVLGLLPQLVPSDNLLHPGHDHSADIEIIPHDHSDSFTGLLASGIEEASHHSSGVFGLIVDYTLSIINLVIGVYLVGKRPNDRVTRLLGVAMVGTAAAYNFHAHTLLGILSILGITLPDRVLNVFHIMHFWLHALSGAAYLHALLIFPNGKIAPRWTRWLIYGVYAIVAEELILTTILGIGLLPGLFTVTFGIEDFLESGRSFSDIMNLVPQASQTIIASETLFYVLLFGLVIPVFGVVAQIYRYQQIANRAERQQTKIVVWSLGVAFSVALLYTLVILALKSPELSTGSNPQQLAEIGNLFFPFLPIVFVIIPISLAFAILQNGLWNIDIVVNRTLVYGMLTAIAAGFFFLAMLLLQILVGQTRPIIAMVIAGIVSGVIYSPMQKRIQNFVDKRIFGLRFDLNDLQAAQSTRPVTNAGRHTGRVLGGYEVHDVIGHGGMAEVYRGVAPDGEPVAIKIMFPKLAEDETMRIRFRREAEIGQRLNHPGIARIYSSGEENGMPYMVMEYIEGEDLIDYLDREQRVSVPEAIRLIHQIGTAIHTAHEQKYVHRDLKPSNIRLRPNSDAVIMDFGITKMTDVSLDITGSGVIGTIDYMAPEQILSSSEVDRRADIYAMGVLLYELLTGRKPFKGNAGQVMFAHIQQPTPDPRALMPELDPIFAEVIKRAMEKDPNDRFDTALQFIESLASIHASAQPHDVLKTGKLNYVT